MPAEREFLFLPIDQLHDDVDPSVWLWEPILATGMITLFTSQWKSGKTTLLSTVLRQLRLGGEVAGAPVTPGSAIVVSEEPASLWVSRDARLEFGPACRLLCRPFPVAPSLDAWQRLIARLADTDASLVVIDPLAMVLPRGAEGHAAAMLDALLPLHELTRAGKAVWLLHHPRKARAGSESSPRGSSVLTSFADILVTLDRPHVPGVPERRRRLSSTSRLAAARNVLIDLSDDGREYTLAPGATDPDAFESGWPILKATLEDAASRLTRKALLQHWPQDHVKPSMTTLVRWLDRAVQEGQLELHGLGRSNDPFAYMVPGQSLEMELPPLDLKPLIRKADKIAEELLEESEAREKRRRKRRKKRRRELAEMAAIAEEIAREAEQESEASSCTPGDACNPNAFPAELGT